MITNNPGSYIPPLVPRVEIPKSDGPYTNNAYFVILLSQHASKNYALLVQGFSFYKCVKSSVGWIKSTFITYQMRSFIVATIFLAEA